jgi:TorA maturation chaperone TorD
MRDTGLELAIEAAGGVGALARSLGIAQPSVSNWKQIPHDRVLNIEQLTGVPRTSLRPDLYPSDEKDEFDGLRAENYRLLSVLLGKAPTTQILDILKSLKGDASPLGMAYIALAAAANISEEKVGREYFTLFIGLGRGDFLPYGSYYQTGFLHEKPLANVRGDMARLGISRADHLYEPEDHIAILCDMMAGMLDGVFENDSQAFFMAHIKPWAHQFFAELEIGENATFYRAVGLLGRTLMEIEAESYTLN